MKYPSSLTLPEAILISLSGIGDGSLDGSKIGIRVWDWICSSAGLKTGAGPLACAITELDRRSVKSSETSATTGGACLMIRNTADPRCADIKPHCRLSSTACQTRPVLMRSAWADSYASNPRASRCGERCEQSI